LEKWKKEKNRISIMHVKPAGLLLIGIEIPPLRYAAVGMTRNNNSPKKQTP